MLKSSNVGFESILLFMDYYCNVYDKIWAFNDTRYMRLFPVGLLFCITDVNQSFYLIMQLNESCVYSVLLKSLKSNQQTSLVSALSNIIILVKHLHKLFIYLFLNRTKSIYAKDCIIMNN